MTTSREVTKSSKGSSDRPGIVFSKSSTGGHAALVDLAIFERFTRSDSGKKENKAGKIISRLFPAQIDIHPPKEATDVGRHLQFVTLCSYLFGKNL